MKRLTAIALVVCAAAAAATPALAIKQFIVFFDDPNPEQLDPGQWTVGAEGDAVISEVASLFAQRSNPDDTLHLTAADQRVGTLEMSIERSRRRAVAVKQSLVTKGVPDQSIIIHACGFQRLMVETPPGAREPMNRFVTMDLHDRDERPNPCTQ
jgi:hypothetical protein